MNRDSPLRTFADSVAVVTVGSTGIRRAPG
jgi:hypothetical protein